MPRATCRCGQVLSIPVNGPERVICPKCQARIRVRKDSPEAPGGDGGFIRFDCPCGRRLKARAAPGGELPQAGKCPDCGRVVPVPSRSTSSSSAMARSPANPESRTEEMDQGDIAVLDRWSQTHDAVRPSAKPVEVVLPETEHALTGTVTGPFPVTVPTPVTVPARAEAGLRVCPRCGRPVHLSALTCRECGSQVPKR